jgi:hypothetical protein
MFERRPAMPKTELTSTGATVFGSMCLAKMREREPPSARAARTYSSEVARRTSARTSRATSAQRTIATATTRESAEDYELFRMLEKADKAKADELCLQCYTSFNEVDYSVARFESAHRALLEAVSKL